MIKTAFFTLFYFCLILSAQSQEMHSSHSLPDSIFSGVQGKMHVQGIAIDKNKGHVYFSFTDRLIKTDLSGQLIGSVIGFAGHLGDLDFNDRDGKVYGSLEYKNDVIGKGISDALGIQDQSYRGNGFYIAVFDGSKIVRSEMEAESEDLLRTVYLPEVVQDFEAEVKVGDRIIKHRFACSGIDGVAFAPAIGSSDVDKKYLYVAYGIYGDTSRSDNDHQVLLKYDVSTWSKYTQHLSQEKLHRSGPKKPLEKYFIKTGNTRYGIQNLAYDSYSGNLFAAVYRGAKAHFPNYDLFVIDGQKKPVTTKIVMDNKNVNVKTLSLLQAGLKDSETGIRGWNFKWGATGLNPLGDGLFYISHNGKNQEGQQYSTLYKYKWTGRSEEVFVRTE